MWLCGYVVKFLSSLFKSEKSIATKSLPTGRAASLWIGAGEEVGVVRRTNHVKGIV